MASSDQLKKIAGFSDQLLALDDKVRGNPIEAADWNTLVGVMKGVLEIDRVQEEAAVIRFEERFSPREHEHVGAVSKEWLDPELQKALLSGGSSVSLKAAFADVRKRVDSLAAEVARLGSFTSEQQKNVDRFAVNDVERATRLNRMDDRLGTIDGLRAAVDQVAGEFDSVRKNVDQVLELRGSLLDASGKPIDVSRLPADIEDLRKLRDNLTGVDGTLLRMRDVELRLNELSDAVGLGGGLGLDSRFESFQGELDGRIDQDLTALGTRLTDDFSAMLAEERVRTQGDITTAVAGATSTFDSKLTAAIGGLRVETTAQLEDRLTAERQVTRTETSGLVQAAVAQQSTLLDQKIATAVDSARASLEGSLRQSITESVTAAANARVDAAEGRLVTRLTGAAEELTRQTSETEARLEAQLSTATADAAAAIRAETSGLITAARDAMSAQIVQQVKTAFAENAPTLDASIRAAVTAQLADLDSRISRAVESSIAGLPDAITAAVQVELAKADVAGQISAAITSASADLRKEFQTGLNVLQQNQTSAITAAVTGLRGELSAAVAEGVKSSVSQAGDMVARLRQESSDNLARELTTLTKRITDLDVRVKDLDDRVTRLPRTGGTITPRVR